MRTDKKIWAEFPEWFSGKPLSQGTEPSRFAPSKPDADHRVLTALVLLLEVALDIRRILKRKNG